MSDPDVIVIGGGIAGVSIAYELSAHAKVLLLEMEPTLAYHTTGRSAATFLESYGPATFRALTTGSRAFLESPPEFFEQQLLHPRGLIAFGKPGRGAEIEQAHAEVSALVSTVELLDSEQVCAMHPLVRPGVVERAIYEPDAMEIDVMALHQGYVRGLAMNKADVVKGAKVVALTRNDGSWTVETQNGDRHSAAAVVNAAGAWGDVIGGLAGAEPVGLTPMRRTIFMVNSPRGAEYERLPIFGDVFESFYIKPEGTQFLCSPADVTPTEPSDAKADELEIARAIEEINTMTHLEVHGITTSWAGLRSFVADHSLVMGPDPEVDGFHWFVGQGGYGIQSGPAAARAAAALVRGEEFPADLVANGLTAEQLSAGRPGLSEASH